MTVIKESHASILRRKNMDAEKRRILNMDFNKKDNRADWERLNRFLLERQSQTQSEVAAQESQMQVEKLTMEPMQSQTPAGANATPLAGAILT